MIGYRAQEAVTYHFLLSPKRKNIVEETDMIVGTDGEQMMAELVGHVYEMFPGLDAEHLRNYLSNVFIKYDVVRIDGEEEELDFADKAEMFLATKQLEGASPHTISGYRIELNAFARTIVKKVSQITSADIRVYLSSDRSWKMSTVGRKLSVLKSFFGWLAEEGFIPYDPTARIKTPKTEKLMSKALTIEELELLRESCTTVRQRALLEVMYATGCRLSEVENMNVDDIDYKSMSLKVIGKGSKEREVYLSFKASYHLEKYLKVRKVGRDNDLGLFLGVRRPFRRLGGAAIEREIKKIARNAGLDHKVSPHILRHTFATLTLNNGADLTAVQELLGHSSPQTTLRYARITEERKREQHRKYLIQ